MVFYRPPGTVVAMTQLQPTSTLRQPGATPSRAALWLYAAYAALLAVACLGPMVPQAASYHAFADQRSWGALPFAMDVLTNLPFGHVATKVLLPVGAKVSLSVEERDALIYWGHAH